MGFKITRLVAVLSAVSALVFVLVPAAAQAAPGDWQAGPGGVLDNTYTGFIDVPAGGTVPSGGSFMVAGWFVDKTAQGWAGADDVQVWLGTMDGGGKMLAKAAFAQSRPDVATALGNPYDAASGFGAIIAGSAVPAGPQTLNVYAHTGGKGWWFKGVGVTGGGAGTGTAVAAPAPSAPAPSSPSSGAAPVVQVTAPTENQNVTTKSDFTITGSTSDAPNIDRIEVWIGGERNAPGGQLLGTVTPGSDGSFTVTFKPTRFASTHQNLYVYSHDRVTNLETEAVRGFNIVDHS